MKLAVALARRGLGATYPNPSVGAVVVCGDEVVGEGRTAPTGGPHAEVRALLAAGARARGATLYVTLEPCCHVGRTGPCTEAIIDAGIVRVVIGTEDPASHVNGQGVARLRAAGIDVDVGISPEDCVAVHEHYLHHVRTQRPFVTLKSAMSLDGRVATRTGASRWITGPQARVEVHRLRAEHHAIAVGVGTVLADDPHLDVRDVAGASPIPIVFDTRLRLAREARWLVREGTIILHGPDAATDSRSALLERGVALIELPCDARGAVDVPSALLALGQREIRSLLVEGGPTLLASCLESAAWQRWYAFIAPCLLGADGSPVVRLSGPELVASALRGRPGPVRRIGDDLLWILDASEGDA